MSNNLQRVSLAPDIIMRVIDGEAVMLKLGDEEVFALNQTAARVVQFIVEGKNVDAMVDVLSGEYQMEKKDVECDVSDLLDALASKGLVIVEHTGTWDVRRPK